MVSPNSRSASRRLLPPGLGQCEDATVFAYRGPAMMDMHQESASRANHPGNVPQHLPAMPASLNHPESAEQTDRMVRGMIRKAVELNQVGTQRQYRTLAADGFLGHHLQHRLAQIDSNDRVPASGQGKSGPTAATAEVEDRFRLGFLGIRSRKSFVRIA